MTEEAKVTSTKSISRIWIIPILVVVVGGWMVYQQWKNQGPLITIELQSATGIEVNKTPIKVRDLDVGQVKKITLKPNLDGVLVTARIDANASHLLTDKSEFWVVAPRISFSEVSGLNTLLSGSYIAMAANDSGKEQLNFIALERPPVTPAGTPGLHVILQSDDEFAYKPGDPIIYKGFKVGEFEDAVFNIEERVVYYDAFIEAPYHKLVTENTRFWDVSGVKLKLESSGVKMETGSLETLLANGITFGVPEGVQIGEQVVENAFFTIYGDIATASNARYKLTAEYVLLVDESVRGLTVGAPVEYRGIEIGNVTAINSFPAVEGNILERDYPIPVIINIYPGKVRQPDTEEGLNAIKQTIRNWLRKDLRATLRMGNVLTGGLFVDLQHVSKPDDSDEIAVLNGYEVIPTVSNEFTQITQKADAILDKINQLPLGDMVSNVLLAVEDMKLAAQSVETASDDFDLLIENVDTELLNTNLNQVLISLDSLLKNYSEGGLSQSEIKETVDTMQDTMRNLQPLLLKLNQSPNSLIFTDSNSSGIEPKAKN
ncbi:intermembrane transport protein PqiB [Alteromonas sp. K632G]|jgi:paraquat-inducible protein B|uniref:Paraquat-inducible protein B n=1 Tax=Alteromonas naphthalenivorans TaxID=715451 RepID=F5ZDD6_ALTNA|nr:MULTISPECIES: intermembrane transport protein PqiB [Alteromonas]AEF03898.1 paraquat-inducible protein B [Alteromonas naphthalenivorans]MBB66932.1 paraquat-inducible protein B [Rickettsiales bacterium]MBO7923428.1 intermembrane transport protein PqiB [Alteromonas sp. K632G]PHS53976.1 MAG: paraquat-inducible protein B [Alteromonas sp.]|tara:strand:- start:1396 stop:3030 length:1635 start_codon:yes stop_codon:yes gene_type:complete